MLPSFHSSWGGSWQVTLETMTAAPCKCGTMGPITYSQVTDGWQVYSRCLHEAVEHHQSCVPTGERPVHILCSSLEEESCVQCARPLTTRLQGTTLTPYITHTVNIRGKNMDTLVEKPGLFSALL